MTPSISTPRKVLGYFKLKNCLDYRFYNRLGQKAVILVRGQIVPVTQQTDLEFFRARGDVMVECNQAGVPLDQVGLVNGFDPKKTKSFAVYSKAPLPQAVAPGARNVQAPPPAPNSGAQPAAVVQVGGRAVQPVGRSPLAGVPLVQPPVPNPRAPRPRTGNESPVEILNRDGSVSQSISV
jgi:hypothetical protein